MSSSSFSSFFPTWQTPSSSSVAAGTLHAWLSFWIERASDINIYNVVRLAKGDVMGLMRDDYY